MTRFSRIVQALGVSFLLMFLLSACGGDGDRDDGEPAPEQAAGPVIAWIGEDTVTEPEVEQAKAVTMKVDAAMGFAPAAPDPPRFDRCVALSLRAARMARTRPLPSERELRRACRESERNYTTGATSRLIQSVWRDREASRRGLEIGEAEVMASMTTFINSAFPERGAYAAFLQERGVREADLRALARENAVATSLNGDIEQAVTVDGDKVDAYYEANEEQFTIPERRDLELVMARTRAAAEQAERALEGGESIDRVTDRFTRLPLLIALGGRLDGVAADSLQRSFSSLAFAARRGEVVGPARAEGGWYVGRVADVAPGRLVALDEVREPLSVRFAQEARSEVATRFANEFTRRWTAATRCAAGHLVPECSNAPRRAARGE